MINFIRLMLICIAFFAISTARGAELVAPSLPKMSYVGKNVRIVLSGTKNGREHRVLRKSDGVDWDWGALWSTEHVLEFRPEKAGILFLGLQSRKIGSVDVEENLYLGQMRVLDPADTLDSLARPIERLTLLNVSSDLSLVASDLDWRRGVDTPRKLVDVIRAKTKKDSYLTYATSSDDGKFALKAMQFVSGLWHYGNYDNTQATGCVANNERDLKTQSSLTFEDYIQSPIGCCADYSMILGAVLEYSGIKSRIIETETHVFNEVYIEERWWTLDANIGVAYDAPWDVVIDGASSVRGFRFPLAGTQAGSRIYGEAAGSFRDFMIFVAASGLMYEFTRTDFAEWKRGMGSF